MELIRFDADHSGVTVTDAMLERAARANELLHTGKGAGNDFLGWVSLPSSIGEKELSDIESVAAKLRGKADTVICIGIGGSYLGAKAVLEAMTALTLADALLMQRRRRADSSQAAARPQGR